MNQNQNIKKCYCVNLVIILLLVASSCKKFVEIGPPKTEIINETVFTSDASATAAIRGIYTLMMGSQTFTNGYMELYSGLSADEFTNYSTNQEQLEFYMNSLGKTNSRVLQIFWANAYRYINNANGVLEGLEKSTLLTTTARLQLEGEAKFIRAFCHFYLVNLFGDVPYISTTDYRINAVASRMPKEEVYQKIISDLKDAQNLLASDFSFSNGQRNQPNKGAATAMLARVYLYTGEWGKAEIEATTVINNSSVYTLQSNLNDVFLKNSSETIWQLMPVIDGSNTNHGQLFILINTPNNILGRVALSNGMYNSFEAGDNRKVSWVNSYNSGTDTWYFPYKYKVDYSSSLTEYAMILRLAEQYLIRAEARAQQNNISGAQADLNVIRNRAGLVNTTANDKALLLLAIENERRSELFTEWGHRWLDLKRTNRADAVLGPLKGSNWQSTDVLYPIPESERLVNPNLTQNPGYQ